MRILSVKHLLKNISLFSFLVDLVSLQHIHPNVSTLFPGKIQIETRYIDECNCTFAFIHLLFMLYLYIQSYTRDIEWFRSRLHVIQISPLKHTFELSLSSPNTVWSLRKYCNIWNMRMHTRMSITAGSGYLELIMEMTFKHLQLVYLN